MRLTFATTLAAAITTCSSFTIPAQQKDGLYRVYYDDDGKAIHEPVDLNNGDAAPINDSATPRSETRALERRDGSTRCGCGFNLNHEDTDKAVDYIRGWAGNLAWLYPNQGYYGISGGTVAFVCNKDQQYLISTSSSDIGRDLGDVTRECGWYVAGTKGSVDVNSNWNFATGYMTWFDGRDFCGDAFGSPVDHC